MKYSSIFLVCLMLGVTAVSLSAQSDTTQLKFSTEEVDPDQWNKKIKFRSTSRLSVMDDAKSVISVGLGISDTGGYYFTYIPTTLNISYERKIFSPAFTARIELVNKLARSNVFEYDYIIQERVPATGLVSSERIGRSNHWLNLSFRYYYNKNRRIRSGRSGNNPFGQYVIAEIFSPLSFNVETQRSYLASGNVTGLLLSKRERNFIGTNRATVSFAWGIQQRILKKLFLDVNIGAYINRDRHESVTFPLYPTLSFKTGFLIIQK